MQKFPDTKLLRIVIYGGLRRGGMAEFLPVSSIDPRSELAQKFEQNESRTNCNAVISLCDMASLRCVHAALDPEIPRSPAGSDQPLLRRRIDLPLATVRLLRASQAAKIHPRQVYIIYIYCFRDLASNRMYIYIYACCGSV